jgi:hypothetical protein
MKLDATPETVRAVAEMFKFAAFLDDRMAGADKGRIMAWAEQLQRHNLSREDLLDGLQHFYDSPSERAIGIGDLLAHSRVCHRDRIEKEDAEIRDIRREAQDAKAEEETAELAASVVMGPVKNKTPRLFEAEHELQRCHGKREALAAIREYAAAKKAARKAGAA